MNPKTIILGDAPIGDAITAFPAAYNYAEKNETRIWFANKDVGALWKGPAIEVLEAEPTDATHLNILRPHHLFVRSGLHMVQAWFHNFDLPVPHEWHYPALNYTRSLEISEVLDVIISPFSRSGGGGLKLIPFPRWNRIIDALIGMDLAVGICGQFRTGADPTFWGERRVTVLDSLPLNELLRRLSGARCVATVDNGIGHLAHLLNLEHVHLIPRHPDLAPRTWTENKHASAVVVHQSFELISVDTVLSAIFKKLSSFSRASYLGLNLDLTRNVEIVGNRLGAWHHYNLFGKNENRIVEDAGKTDLSGIFEDFDFDPENLKELAANFLSLGDNCEFGLVQRHLGAEPLDLLRWFSVPFGYLCDALARRFENFGAEENLEVLIADGQDEFVLHEKSYRFVGHTFVNPAGINIAAFQRQQALRLRFLARKLVEDLENGERVVVFKRNEDLADEDILQLGAAIQKIGPTPLLVVHQTNKTTEVGKIKKLGENVYRGYVDRLASYKFTTEISPGSWIALLLNMSDILGHRKPRTGRETDEQFPIIHGLPKEIEAAGPAHVIDVGQQSRSDVTVDIGALLAIERIRIRFVADSGGPNTIRAFKLQIGPDNRNFYESRECHVNGELSPDMYTKVFETEVPIPGKVVRITWANGTSAKIDKIEILGEPASKLFSSFGYA